MTNCMTFRELFLLFYMQFFLNSSDQSGWNVTTGTEMEGEKVKSRDFLSPI